MAQEFCVPLTLFIRQKVITLRCFGDKTVETWRDFSKVVQKGIGLKELKLPLPRALIPVRPSFVHSPASLLRCLKRHYLLASNIVAKLCEHQRGCATIHLIVTIYQSFLSQANGRLKIFHSNCSILWYIPVLSIGVHIDYSCYGFSCADQTCRFKLSNKPNKGSSTTLLTYFSLFFSVCTGQTAQQIFWLQNLHYRLVLPNQMHS